MQEIRGRVFHQTYQDSERKKAPARPFRSRAVKFASTHLSPASLVKPRALQPSQPAHSKATLRLDKDHLYTITGPRVHNLRRGSN